MISENNVTIRIAFVLSAALSAALLAGTPAGAAAADRGSPPSAKAVFRNLDGEVVGSAALTETPNGVLIIADLSGLAPGIHGFHIHAVGACEPPFKTAGGHFNPDGGKHGYLSPEGFHAGDLPNITAGPDGKAHVEALAASVTLGGGPNGLLDADGSSLVIHAAADDYATDPAGNSGDRIACALITR